MSRRTSFSNTEQVVHACLRDHAKIRLGAYKSDRARDFADIGFQISSSSAIGGHLSVLTVSILLLSV
jgi:hypothetical protein